MTKRIEKRDVLWFRLRARTVHSRSCAAASAPAPPANGSLRRSNDPGRRYIVNFHRKHIFGPAPDIAHRSVAISKRRTSYSFLTSMQIFSPERLRSRRPLAPTFLAALRANTLAAPCVVDGPINGIIFRAYVKQFVVPELRPGDIVVLDNLGSHRAQAIRSAILVAAPRCGAPVGRR